MNNASSLPTSNDYDEYPEITQADLDRAKFRVRLKPAEQRIHSQHVATKMPLTVQFSIEVIDYFRNIGPDWQSRMDEALKEWISVHPIA